MYANKAEEDEEESDEKRKETPTAGGSGEEEFDLSDISANPADKSREEIIAAAEAAAFGEE